MPDHVHILIGLRPDTALSPLIRDVKSDSSAFINGKKWLRGNSTGRKDSRPSRTEHSQLDSVIKYIQNQQKHHEKQSFKQEYLTLLRRFRVEFREPYLFEWIEGT